MFRHSESGLLSVHREGCSLASAALVEFPLKPALFTGSWEGYGEEDFAGEGESGAQDGTLKSKTVKLLGRCAV